MELCLTIDACSLFFNKTLIENIKKLIETKKSTKKIVDSLVNIVVMLLPLKEFFL